MDRKLTTFLWGPQSSFQCGVDASKINQNSLSFSSYDIQEASGTMPDQERLQQVLRATLDNRKEVREPAASVLEELSKTLHYGWDLVTCALTCNEYHISQMSRLSREDLPLADWHTQRL